MSVNLPSIATAKTLKSAGTSDLKPNDTVSELVFSRMPGATQAQKMQMTAEVLKLNGLTWESAKSLPAGFDVKLPTQLMKAGDTQAKAPAKEPEKAAPKAPAVATPPTAPAQQPIPVILQPLPANGLPPAQAPDNSFVLQPMPTAPNQPPAFMLQPVSAIQGQGTPAVGAPVQQGMIGVPVAPQVMAQQPVVQQPMVQQPVVQQPIAQQPLGQQQPIAQQPLGTRQNDPTKITVAQLDTFFTDNTGFNHGQEIAKTLRNGGADPSLAGKVNLLQYRVDGAGPLETTMANQTANALQDVINKVRSGQDVDAVNMSLQDFNASIGAGQVRSLIQQLGQMNVPVLVAAGNAGPTQVNQLTTPSGFVVQSATGGRRNANSGIGNIQGESSSTSFATASLTPKFAAMANAGLSVQQLRALNGIQ